MSCKNVALFFLLARVILGSGEHAYLTEMLHLNYIGIFLFFFIL